MPMNLSRAGREWWWLPILVAVAGALSCGTQPTPRPTVAPAAATARAVVLTTDCGTEIDDQWALAHLALSPEVELRGVIGTHAPNLAEPAAQNAARAARVVLSNLPVTVYPPVIAGSDVPLADP